MGPSSGTFLEFKGVRGGIGLAGGVLLLLMGVELLASLRRWEIGSTTPIQRHPLWTGIVLSGANPHFILWWATVGLTLTGQAMELHRLLEILCRRQGFFRRAHGSADLEQG